MSDAPTQLSTGSAEPREFGAWFNRTFLDPDGGSAHLPYWFRCDMQQAWNAALECGAESNRHSGAVGAEKRAEQSNPGGGHEVTEHDAQKPYEQKAAGMIPRPAASSCGAAQQPVPRGELAGDEKERHNLAVKIDTWAPQSKPLTLIARERRLIVDALRYRDLAYTAKEPNGLANLRAIVADQPFQNSSLSVHEINLILANEGGFMPDEAVIWFRASRGTFGTSSMPSTHICTPPEGK